MLPRSLMLAASGLAVAATTQAFLLPADINLPDISPQPIGVSTVPNDQTLDVACPGCLLFTKSKHGVPKFKSDKAGHLELSFHVDNEQKEGRLLVNEFEIYPASDPLRAALSAPLLPDEGHKKDEKYRKHPQDLGFSLQVRTFPVSEDGLQLIDLDLQVFEVGSKFVRGIPAVHIMLVKSPDGKLATGTIEPVESQTLLDSSPMDKQKECATLLCKWMAIMKEKMGKIKAGKHCGGMLAGHVGESRPHHGDGEHHHHHHQEHEHGQNEHGAQPDKVEHHRHRSHSWAMLFKNIAAHILLPVAVGLIAGVFVSLIGMLVGTLIVSLWRAFFRRPSRRHAGRSLHKTTNREDAAVEEKSGLMDNDDNQDPAPPYEDGEVKKAEV